MVGLWGNSRGDLQAFDAAYELLKGKGAKRFFFLGDRYSDLDDWLLQKKQSARGNRPYDDQAFLSDVTDFLVSQGPAERAAAKAEDVNDVSQLVERFVRVPDPAIGKRAMDMLGETLCCLVHDKNDLTREDLLNATLFIHANQPEPRVVQIGPRFFVNPGQLIGAAEQTCGLITFGEKELLFSAFTLEGRTLIENHPIPLGRRTKLSVE